MPDTPEAVLPLKPEHGCNLADSLERSSMETKPDYTLSAQLGSTYQATFEKLTFRTNKDGNQEAVATMLIIPNNALEELVQYQGQPVVLRISPVQAHLPLKIEFPPVEAQIVGHSKRAGITLGPVYVNREATGDTSSEPPPAVAAAVHAANVSGWDSEADE